MGFADGSGPTLGEAVTIGSKEERNCGNCAEVKTDNWASNNASFIVLEIVNSELKQIGTRGSWLANYEVFGLLSSWWSSSSL